MEWTMSDLGNETEPVQQTEGLGCEPCLASLDGETVLVYGDPVETGEKLDDLQGDNYYDFQGDCGLVSVANLLTMAGVEGVTEDDVVGLAIRYRCCEFSSLNDSSENGGTTVVQRWRLMQMFGIDATIFAFDAPQASLECLADYVESGRGVNLGLNAGYAWGDPNYIQDGVANHSVVLTGTCRDPETGDLKGFFLCDSGAPNGSGEAMYLSVEQMEQAYLNAYGATALVTDQPIR